MLEPLKRFSRGPGGLARDTAGAIAPMFGVLMALVLVPLVGMSVDVSRTMSSRNDLQDASDAVALMLAKMPTNSTQAQLQTAANQWIAADVADKNLGPVTVTVTPNYGTGANATNTIDLTASSSVKTTVAAVMGVTSVPVSAHSTTTWGISKLEVALVLDNTGSMNSNNKIQTLISSANQLVSTLFSQTPNASTNLRISVVPFSQTVNVGSTYQSSNWITGKLPAAYTTALQSAYPGITFPYGDDIFTTASTDRFAMFKAMNTSWGGCVESRPAPYDAQETAPDPANPATMFVPYFAPDEPDKIYYSGSYYSGYYANTYIPDVASDYNSPNQNNPSRWQGDAAKYAGAHAATGQDGLGASSYNLGPNSGCQIVPLLKLTNNQQTITNTINSMVAVGDTNLNIGMMWGWHTLSPNAPFGDGTATSANGGAPYKTPNLQKIIVFLTDGWNEATPTPYYSNGIGYLDHNQSYYSGIGYIWQNRVGVGLNSTQAQRQAALDARTAQVCSNINGQGITVYTVRIDVAGSQSPAVLQNCASTPDKFYDVPDVSNLPATFAKIATSIGNLRISK